MRIFNSISCVQKKINLIKKEVICQKTRRITSFLTHKWKRRNITLLFQEMTNKNKKAMKPYINQQK